MKIALFDAKQYEIEAFELARYAYPKIEIDYFDTDISCQSVELAHGADAVCIFVDSKLDRELIEKLRDLKIGCILLRCAGYNNVDLAAARACNIMVFRVPAYSPEAVAEHAMALALSVNRHIHKGYIRVRENNFSLNGLVGVNFFGKTAGIIGTGKIGVAMCKLCRGFGMKVLAFDVNENPELDFAKYVSLDELLRESDLISVHCPLTEETYHIICEETIEKMKDNVIFVNTSRGALVDTDDLIKGIRKHKFFGVGLDVYEEEAGNVFENRENEVLASSVTARLLSFPNVIVTSHQGFLTKEALTAISHVTLQNAESYETGSVQKENQVI